MISDNGGCYVGPPRNKNLPCFQSTVVLCFTMSVVEEHDELEGVLYLGRVMATPIYR